MSATYRQSSRVTPDRLAKDPANRLLSRGPRFRLDAEMLRDQALFAQRPAGRAASAGRASSRRSRPGCGRRSATPAATPRSFAADTGAREGPPPQPVHLLEADLAAAADDHLRRPSREACIGPPRADQHAAAGPAADERAAVRRGVAGPGRADPAARAAARPTTRLAYMFRLATARRPDAKELAELTRRCRTSWPTTPRTPPPRRS